MIFSSSCILNEKVVDETFITLSSASITSSTPQITQTPQLTNTPYPIHSPTVTATPSFLNISYKETQWFFYALDDHFPSILANQGQKNSMSSIAFSPKGVAWVGSSAGLWRHEKGSWASYLQRDGMLSDGVWTIAIAPNGDVWAGSSNVGFSHFDGKDWKTHPMLNVSSVNVAPDGKVWVSHNIQNKYGDIYRVVSFYDGIDWHIVIDEASEVSVGPIAIAADGVIWLGTNSDGIIKLDGEVTTHFPIGTFKNYRYSGGVCGLCVGAIEIAPDGTTWAMAATSGLVHFNGEDWTTYPYYTDGGPKTIAVSEEGIVWVGEVFGNVVAFMEDEQWYAFTGLPFNKVYDIHIAPSGEIWFATGEGLYIYRD